MTFKEFKAGSYPVVTESMLVRIAADEKAELKQLAEIECEGNLSMLLRKIIKSFLKEKNGN